MIRQLLRRYKQARKMRQRLAAGKPIPMPGVAKRALLREVAERHKLGVFVETGTHRGETPWALRDVFGKIYTIEIEPLKVEAAKKLFAKCPHVECLQGDSGKVLPQVLAKLDKPALFWLDGHFMDEHSGDPNDPTPVSAEVKMVLEHPVRGHVILIDDARLFGTPGYPTLEAVRGEVMRRRPDLEWSVELDVIRLVPR
mgnify:CR=1 FL=1